MSGTKGIQIGRFGVTFAAAVALALLADVHLANGQVSSWQAEDYAILMQAGGSLTVTGNSPANKIIGNVGIGSGSSPGSFVGTGATGLVMGHAPGNFPLNTVGAIDFAAAGGYTYTPGSLVVTDGAGQLTSAVSNVSNVTTALTELDNTASFAAGATLTPAYNVDIANGGSVNLSAFAPNDGQGDIIFNATIDSSMSSSFGGIFNIIGSTNQTVVFNIAGANPTLEGAIQLFGPTLTGGAILPTNVYFNFITPGNLLTIDTDQSANNHQTEGMYLDPFGSFNVTNSEIFGTVLGGGNSQWSSSTIFFAPEPSGIVIAGIGIGLLLVGRQISRRRKGGLA